MFVQFSVVILIFLRPIDCQKVLEFSSFTDESFTDLDDWNLIVVEQKDSGIDKPPQNTLSYAGFNSIYWDRNSDVYIAFGHEHPNQGIIKYYNNLKSHKALLITFQIYIFNNQHNPAGNCNVDFFIDGQKQYTIQPNFNQYSRVFKQNVDLSMTHTHKSLFIQFSGKPTDANIVTFGIRDFYLYSIPCPMNCQFCRKTDQLENECIDWQLASEFLVEIDRNLYNSDGWTINQANPSMILHKSIDCNYESSNYMQFIGFMEMGDQIKKTIILEPHFRIKIQYLQILIAQEFAPQIYWYGYLNGKIQYQVGYVTYTASPPICSKLLDKTRGDLIQQVEYESFHQDTLVEFLTLASQSIQGSKTLWGIRNFQILIKKCHPNCQYSCFGPLETQCQNTKYPKFTLHENSLNLDTFSDDQEWQVLTLFQFTNLNLCNNQALLGGYNNLQGRHFIQSVYDLKPHVKIGLSFKVYFIDKFYDEQFYVIVDGTIVYQYTIPSIVDSKKDMPYCGIYAEIDQIMKISIVTIPHTRSQVIIQIQTNQPDTSISSWGIREFILTLNGIPNIKNLNDLKFSNQNISPWKIALQNSPIWLCGSKSYIGGINALDKDSQLRKTFKNIPNHIQIRISFSIVTIQSALRQTQFILQQNINDSKKVDYLQIQDKKYCQGIEYTHLFKFDYVLDHKEDDLFILFYIEQMNAQEFWSFRDFQLSYNNQITQQ
ncbi:unnamed protein product [Paramecium sonneborni]|uniref:Uncharacterized protein n=1 Tax=Paramecium sonneborni TaxID=65129 RepID=A0A8S1QCD7_9CILI|nr:unnamed protein product [Paramecium sonneborni]